MYYQIQRYKFESNSQHTSISCYSEWVVLSNTKIQIWKQFTTDCAKFLFSHTLYYQIQRYKFESNSQLHLLECPPSCSCIIKYKDTNLKAIHNACWVVGQVRYVVLSNTKIQIWKQFTTLGEYIKYEGELYYQIQRYKFESNSQQCLCCTYTFGSCIIKYKDTNLKAIHNKRNSISFARGVVLSNTKIQIWKQFTTNGGLSNFASRCIIKYKDTNLKAIHNALAVTLSNEGVVLSNTKIQIWKQFTTSNYFESKEHRCIIKYKDTNLKAIHNC